MSYRHLPYTAFLCTLAVAAAFSVGCRKASTPQTSTQSAAQSALPPGAQQQPSDDQVASAVQARLQADSGLANLPIQVQAKSGVVTLSGSVSSQAARELAAQDAAQASGVRTVVNNIEVRTVQAAVVPNDAAKKAAKRAAKKQAEEQAQQQRDQQKQQAAQEQQDREQAEQGNLAPAPANDVQSQAQPTPPPPPQPVTQTVVIPAGTDLAVRITESLATGQTQTNQVFHGVLTNGLVVNGLTAIPRGANVNGVVLDAQDATHFKGRSELSLALQQIRTGSQVLNVSTLPTVRQGAARGKNTAAKAGGGALLGTIIGALAGGGKGALVGAAAGAGVGAGANAVTKGEQVQIPSESVLHFTLNKPLSVTVTTMPTGAQ